MTDHSLSAEALDELRLLRESAAAFVKQHASPARVRRHRDDASEFDRGVWKQLAEAGFLGMAVPEAFGGMGMPLDYRAAIAEEFGKALLPEPFLTSALLTASVIASGDNDALKAELLPKIAAGELVAALAWQEAPDCIDAEFCSTSAEHRSGRIVLKGHKRFVRPGSRFDGIVVSAASDAGIGLYWVRSDAAGLTISSKRLADGAHAAEVSLDAVRIESAAVVQSPSQGAAVLGAAIDEALVLTCADLLGVIRQTLSMTLDFLRMRHQFGKPIGSFQALQHRAVNLFIQQELSEVALNEALTEFRSASTPRARKLAASRAKARCSDTALMMTKEAIQMHGAIGYTDEHDAGLYLKRALVQSSWLGNAAQHRRRYAALQNDADTRK